MSDDAEKVEKIVKGGATAFPKHDGPVPPTSGLKYLQNFVVCNIRGPLLAVAATYLVYPRYHAWLKTMLERGFTEERAFVWAATVIHVAMYFACFAFFETLERFNLLRQYKLARTPGQEPTWNMKARTLVEFSVGQVLNFFATGPIVYGTLVRRGAPSGLAPLPSAWTLFKDFAVANIINRVGFYSAHRLFHHGPLYRAIHKKHHTYVGSVSIAAENAHPIEGIFANALPTLGGCLLMGTHPLVFLVWLTWRSEETYEAHSGYCFAGSFLHRMGLTNADNAAYHDHHHVVNRGNFGDPFTDFLGDTNQNWRATGENEGYIELARKQHEKEGL